MVVAYVHFLCFTFNIHLIYCLVGAACGLVKVHVNMVPVSTWSNEEDNSVTSSSIRCIAQNLHS